MVERDPLTPLHEQEIEMIWLLRYECQFHYPSSLPKLLSCVQWNNYVDVAKVGDIHVMYVTAVSSNISPSRGQTMNHSGFPPIREKQVVFSQNQGEKIKIRENFQQWVDR